MRIARGDVGLRNVGAWTRRHGDVLKWVIAASCAACGQSSNAEDHPDASLADVTPPDGRVDLGDGTSADATSDAPSGDVGVADRAVSECGATGDDPDGGAFKPQPGFSYSGTATGEGSFTVDSCSDVWGTKPNGAAPLVWLPGDDSGTFSSLGRITSGGFQESRGLVWTAPGVSGNVPPTGPSGKGYFSGQANASPEPDAGIQLGYAIAVDLDQWSGNSYAVNSLGQKMFSSRIIWRNFGHYLLSNGYNTKNFRVWARNPNTIGSPQSYPDFYVAPCDQGFNVETGGLTNWIDWSPGPTGTNVMVDDSIVAQAEGGYPGTPYGPTFQTWYEDEIMTRSNSTLAADDADIMWLVEGVNKNQPLLYFPFYSYQWNYWKFLNGPMETAKLLPMMRWYLAHYIFEGASGRNLPPAGTYINYGSLYLDDSWCRVYVTNSATWGDETMRELQIPSAWSPASITVTLRTGRFSSLSGTYLHVVDDNDTDHLVGQFK
jgi:hypothetical protein